MVTLYSINRYSLELETHEYERITEHFAVRRHRGREIRDKMSAVDMFKTSEEAVNHRRELLLQDYETKLHNLAMVRNQIAKFEKLHGQKTEVAS